MISIEFKAEFRRATREMDENAVAHRLRLVFAVSLSEKHTMIDEHFTKFTDFDDLDRV